MFSALQSQIESTEEKKLFHKKKEQNLAPKIEKKQKKLKNTFTSPVLLLSFGAFEVFLRTVVFAIVVPVPKKSRTSLH